MENGEGQNSKMRSVEGKEIEIQKPGPGGTKKENNSYKMNP